LFVSPFGFIALRQLWLRAFKVFPLMGKKILRTKLSGEKIEEK